MASNDEVLDLGFNVEVIVNAEAATSCLSGAGAAQQLEATRAKTSKLLESVNLMIMELCLEALRKLS